MPPGIEEIHPGYALSCVDCHGGDDTATQKDKAHVLPKQALPGDERVLPEGLRAGVAAVLATRATCARAKKVCGTCHDRACDNVLKSLHATTTGHLGDGYYENGLARGKRPAFAVFAARDEDGTVPDKALRAVTQVPGFAQGGREDQIATHYTDLARKACMQCHLWSTGPRGARRVGMDGDYRSEGCGRLPRAVRGGRPLAQQRPQHRQAGARASALQHRFTSRIPTDTCVAAATTATPASACRSVAWPSWCRASRRVRGAGTTGKLVQRHVLQSRTAT